MDAVFFLILIVTGIASLGAAAASFGRDSRFIERSDAEYAGLPAIDVEGYRAARNR